MINMLSENSYQSHWLDGARSMRTSRWPFFQPSQVMKSIFPHYLFDNSGFSFPTLYAVMAPKCKQDASGLECRVEPKKLEVSLSIWSLLEVGGLLGFLEKFEG